MGTHGEGKHAAGPLEPWKQAFKPALQSPWFQTPFPLHFGCNFLIAAQQWGRGHQWLLLSFVKIQTSRQKKKKKRLFLIPICGGKKNPREGF